MDAKLVNPFIDAFMTVLPQIGFQEPARAAMTVKDKMTQSLGVTIIVGFTKQIRGNVVYNMSEDTAKYIASTMMMGMPVPELDDMAQSAISELGNMLAANASILMEGQGVSMNISPPTLIVGESVQARIGAEKRLVVEMFVDSNLVEVDIAVDNA